MGTVSLGLHFRIAQIQRVHLHSRGSYAPLDDELGMCVAVAYIWDWSGPMGDLSLGVRARNNIFARRWTLCVCRAACGDSMGTGD